MTPAPDGPGALAVLPGTGGPIFFVLGAIALAIGVLRLVLAATERRDWEAAEGEVTDARIFEKTWRSSSSDVPMSDGWDVVLSVRFEADGVTREGRVSGLVAHEGWIAEQGEPELVPSREEAEQMRDRHPPGSKLRILYSKRRPRRVQLASVPASQLNEQPRLSRMVGGTTAALMVAGLALVTLGVLQGD